MGCRNDQNLPAARTKLPNPRQPPLPKYSAYTKQPRGEGQSEPTEDDQLDLGNTGGALAVLNEPAPSASALVVPRVIADLGEAATLRFVDFFTANIRNPNTRAAYAIAVRGFFTWLEKHGPGDLAGIRTHHVSAYVELLTRAYKAPTVKQRLAAIRMLFDFLIVGQVVGQNPAAAVRGPSTW
jgi:integrase family protein with SAM-like domain